MKEFFKKLFLRKEQEIKPKRSKEELIEACGSVKCLSDEELIELIDGCVEAEIIKLV